MRSLLVGLLAGLLLALSGVAALPAHADDDDEHPDWRITRWTTDATFGQDGQARVSTTFDFDFAADPGHGPYLTFVTRHTIPDDRDHYRAIDITDVEVSSPTGAPARIDKSEESGGVLSLRIGKQNRTVSGVQTYTVTYTLHGVADPDNAISHLDEVNWTVLGDGFTVPISNATVNLTLPRAADKVACFTGPSFNEQCRTASHSGNRATFSHPYLPTGQPLRVVAGMPVGSLVGAEPRLTPRPNPAKALSPSPVNGGIAGAVLLLGALGLGGVVRRHGRDQAYAGLTPGLTPVEGAPAAVGRAERRANVAVQFTPPVGTTPGEVGTLIDEKADHRDVVATIIDLAVRGHLTVEQLDRKQWRFTRQEKGTDNVPLLGHEKLAMAKLFAHGDSVTTKQLGKAKYAELFPKSREKLYDQVTKERHWFRQNPRSVRIGWLAISLVVAGLGVMGTILGMALNLALPGIALTLVGLAMLACTTLMPARTADGSAVLAQARGFELYLRTAEADQLKFEEGVDIFSRYLPWAIMLGVADRWSKLFEKLAAEGRYDVQPTWYVGDVGFAHGYMWGSMSSIGDSMSQAMQSSQAAAAAASAGSGGGGGSGFSGGGGGFGGGGGGGW
ncbi:DUF2207 domain-containing protein [Luteococcus peritonei]